jgi:hypothetical protein
MNYLKKEVERAGAAVLCDVISLNFPALFPQTANVN